MSRRLLLIALVIAASACDTDEASPSVSQVIATAPDDTLPAPGSCTPSSDDPPVPQIEVDGSSTDATLGTSSDPCDAINGAGYMDFNYNPVLIDASEAVRVLVGDAAATLTWDLGEPFTETSSGTWESAKPKKGCKRLTISVASGEATAIYGADIRVGGRNVDCPQRELDPTDAGVSATPPSAVASDTTDVTNTTRTITATTSPTATTTQP